MLNKNLAKIVKNKVNNIRTTRSSVLSAPPEWVTIGITNACRNRCVFCAYHCEEAKNDSKVYNIPFTMDMLCFKKIVDMAKEAGIPNVHICATGEPFMNRNVLDMMDYCIKIYGSTSIQTCFDQELFEKNQYLDELLKRKNYIRYITSDILSGDPQEHNALKKGSSYEYIMDNIERISKESDIEIHMNWLLTKLNYTSIRMFVDDAYKRKFKNITLIFSNVFTYGFNDFLSDDVLYTVNDIEMIRELEEAKVYAKQHQIDIQLPHPVGSKKNKCDVFWRKVQIWPVQGCEPARYQENMIPCGCRAVVTGNLNSLGYLFDYNNFMDFWNNEKMVSIRKNLINGIYPDEECKYCFRCSNFKLPK